MQSLRTGAALLGSIASLAILTSAEVFLKDSVSLKQKRIVGQFVGFDELVEDNNQMLVLSREMKMQSIPTEKVITIINGWVVIDEDVS